MIKCKCRVAILQLPRAALYAYVTILMSFAAPIAASAQESSSRIQPLRSDEIRRAQSSGRWNSSSAIGSGGEQTFTISKTADTSHSDPLFAGFAIRCDTNGKIDILVVLIEPFPPRTHPEITILSGAKKFRFSSDVATGGAALVIQDEAPLLLEQELQAGPLIKVRVGDGDRAIEGTVTLDGFGAAYAGLLARCRR